MEVDRLTSVFIAFHNVDDCVPFPRDRITSIVHISYLVYLLVICRISSAVTESHFWIKPSRFCETVLNFAMLRSSSSSSTALRPPVVILTSRLTIPLTL